MLTPYYTTRFKCVSCGIFEIGDRDRPEPDFTCPWCDGELVLVAQCRGMTVRPLPFTTDPRTGEEVPSSLDVVNRTVSDGRKRNRSNGKSTGRKRGGHGRAIYRSRREDHDSDADRERYNQQKAAKLSKPDLSSKP